MSVKPLASEEDTLAEVGTRSDTGTFRVIERVMSLLKCLSRYPEGLTLTELSRHSGLHKATTSRFLKALDRGHFVTASNKNWKLGPAFFEIGARAIGRTDLREIARPVMEGACHHFGETVQLAILADDGVVYIEKVEPPDVPLKINTQVGSRRPLHCTALGKVMAAHRDWSEVHATLGRAGMQRMTRRSIVDPTALKSELERVRERGYAVDDHEYNDLVVCAAAPVRNASGDVVAGLSISTFGIAAESMRFKALIEAAVGVAGEISAALGWRAMSGATEPDAKAARGGLAGK